MHIRNSNVAFRLKSFDIYDTVLSYKVLHPRANKMNTPLMNSPVL